MKTPLQTHMENKSEEGKQININSVKEYALKIKVDTTELDEAIKKFKKMNKVIENIWHIAFLEDKKKCGYFSGDSGECQSWKQKARIKKCVLLLES